MPETTLSITLLPPKTICGHILEREINRKVLIDISPDREDLLKSKLNIEDIRQTSKLRVPLTEGYVSFMHQIFFDSSN